MSSFFSKGVARHPFGLDLCSDLPAEALDGLEAALEVLDGAHPSRTRRPLIEAIVPGSMQASRSAISSLRRSDHGMLALPAVTAWVSATAPAANAEDAYYAVRDAFFALGDWRKQLDGEHLAGGERGDAAKRLRAFNNEVTESVAIACLQHHPRMARAIVSYLKDAEHLESAMDAIEKWLASPRSKGGGGDMEYARADALRALEELEARSRRAPSATMPHSPSFPDPLAPVPDSPPPTAIDEEPKRELQALLSLAQHDEESEVRAHAWQLLVRIGRNPAVREAALAAVRDPDPGVRRVVATLLAQTL